MSDPRLKYPLMSEDDIRAHEKKYGTTLETIPEDFDCITHRYEWRMRDDGMPIRYTLMKDHNE